MTRTRLVKAVATALALACLPAGGSVSAYAVTHADTDPPPPLHSRSELPFLENTPDQWMPPDLRVPGARPRAPLGEPFPQLAKYRDLRELEVSPPGEEGRNAPFCTGRTGPYQKELERFLKLTPVDGKQSGKDCAAIQRYQTARKIQPRTGYAGPVTWGAATLEWARTHPDTGGRCPPRRGRVACVDLTLQLMWVQQGRKVVFGPVAVRSGKPGYATRTGTFAIGRRNAAHTSTLYQAPMPYAQFFSGGQAFHGRYRTIYYEPGSHGCVNLSYRNAQRLWSTLRAGDTVVVFGRKPPARRW
ncbi:L,D-transpeptidase [Streptomyces indicus]|uniref:L,D-transpeptidase catalytic domain n=1 Tax=Streptomyces indicus TaxID=417292 RepID=A0A1G9GNK3_9ACTN|nr:L,D-transpeptidase [Streptomyces indicus]SDL02228.1 L,D-transpeptidase catalytic domain [Streptomyces indicus]